MYVCAHDKFLTYSNIFVCSINIIDGLRMKNFEILWNFMNWEKKGLCALSFLTIKLMLQ
jgi:Na+/H+ antiporter NhaA